MLSQKRILLCNVNWIWMTGHINPRGFQSPFCTCIFSCISWIKTFWTWTWTWIWTTDKTTAENYFPRIWMAMEKSIVKRVWMLNFVTYARFLTLQASVAYMCESDTFSSLFLQEFSHGRAQCWHKSCTNLTCFFPNFSIMISNNRRHSKSRYLEKISRHFER